MRTDEIFFMKPGRYTTTKEHFKDYCNGQIASIKVAIDRKAKGSCAEDGYFLEHIEKLKNFFIESRIE
jgi:hypothetical protein